MRPLRTISAALRKGALGPLPGAGLPDALVLLDGFDDGLLLGDGAGQRFLAVDVLLVLGGFGGDQGVPIVRHGQHDGVDVLAGHHLAVIVVGLAVLVLVVAVDLVQGLLEMVLVQVAGGDDLASFRPRSSFVLPGPCMPQPTTPTTMRSEGLLRPSWPRALAGMMVGAATAPGWWRRGNGGG